MKAETFWIQTKKYPQTHCLATCAGCGFSAGIQTDECPSVIDVYTVARRHAKLTGHTVTVEESSSTVYKAI